MREKPPERQRVGGDEEGAVNGAQRVRGTGRTGVRRGEREDAMGQEGRGDGGPSLRRGVRRNGERAGGRSRGLSGGSEAEGKQNYHYSQMVNIRTTFRQINIILELINITDVSSIVFLHTSKNFKN